jgi:hypothetical protein
LEENNNNNSINNNNLIRYFIVTCKCKNYKTGEVYEKDFGIFGSDANEMFEEAKKFPGVLWQEKGFLLKYKEVTKEECLKNINDRNERKEAAKKLREEKAEKKKQNEELNKHYFLVTCKCIGESGEDKIRDFAIGTHPSQVEKLALMLPNVKRTDEDAILNIKKIAKEEFDVFNEQKEKKHYFIVRAKCGHVGNRKFIEVDFCVYAKNSIEAVAIARKFPRVKHTRKDAIVTVRKVEKEEYEKQKLINDNNPYLQLRADNNSERFENLDILSQIQKYGKKIKKHELKYKSGRGDIMTSLVYQKEQVKKVGFYRKTLNSDSKYDDYINGDID